MIQRLEPMKTIRLPLLRAVLVGLLAVTGPAFAAAVDEAPRPNILVIFGDDVGVTNISLYSNGLMGYETPNIDRIGKEGIQFLTY